MACLHSCGRDLCNAQDVCHHRADRDGRLHRRVARSQAPSSRLARRSRRGHPLPAAARGTRPGRRLRAACRATGYPGAITGPRMRSWVADDVGAAVSARIMSGVGTAGVQHRHSQDRDLGLAILRGRRARRLPEVCRWNSWSAAADPGDTAGRLRCGLAQRRLLVPGTARSGHRRTTAVGPVSTPSSVTSAPGTAPSPAPSGSGS